MVVASDFEVGAVEGGGIVVEEVGGEEGRRAGGGGGCARVGGRGLWGDGAGRGAREGADWVCVVSESWEVVGSV